LSGVVSIHSDFRRDIPFNASTLHKEVIIIISLQVFLLCFIWNRGFLQVTVVG